LVAKLSPVAVLAVRLALEDLFAVALSVPLAVAFFEAVSDALFVLLLEDAGPLLAVVLPWVPVPDDVLPPPVAVLV
jgi:hypothetical protein